MAAKTWSQPPLPEGPNLFCILSPAPSPSVAGSLFCVSAGILPRCLILDRTFHCEGCGLVIDRDLNAEKNLAEWPGVARTVETSVEGGVQSTAEAADSASQ